MRINLQDTPFGGNTSRPALAPAAFGRWPQCPNCSSSLDGRHHEATKIIRRAGVTYSVDVYRCGCGRCRHVRRAL